MTNDCQWTEAKIESYFTDELSGEELQRFQGHLASCVECAGKVKSLENIDTFVRGAFQRRVAIAQLAAQTNTRPRVLKIMLTGASLAAAAVLAAVWLTIAPQTPAPPIALQPPPVPDIQNEIKKDNTVENASGKLTKPSDGVPAKTAVDLSLDPNAPNAPDFAITDAAGYTTNLDAYRGRAFLFGVITQDQKAAVAGLQQIYDTFNANRGIRIIGVSRQRDDSLDAVTFPLFFNHGSRLLGVADGEFLLMDAGGKTRLQGSLSNAGDVGRLRSQIEQITAR